MANIEAGRGIDSAVVVPQSIRDGASRADDLIAAEQAKARGEAPPVAPPAQPDGKDAMPPAPLQVQQQAPIQQEVPPAPPQAPPPPQQISPEQWEQRYRAMKGRHDAVAASSQQAITELQRQLAELQGRMQQTPPPPAPAEFDEEDTATWGADLMNFVKRRVDTAVAQVRQELNGRVQHVEHVAQAGSEGALRQQLSQILPNWEEINYNPEFHAWLALPDEMSGVRRQDLVDKAYGERNAQRVVMFFNRFLSEAAPAPAGGHDPAALPAPNGGTPPASQRLSLTDLAAPGPARPAASAGNPAAPTVKRYWTQPEIGQFFAAKHKGLYDRSPEDRALAAAYEADIFAAQAEGRVHPG